MSKTKSSSSVKWLAEHRSDAYVKRAKKEGLRARSAYKLQEIDADYKLLHSGMMVVDLGAAPGSWSEFAAKKVGANGAIFAVDLLPIQPISNVKFLQGDFTNEKTIITLQSLLQGRSIDIVLSDMAPNLSGCNVADQARMLLLNEAALNFSKQVLKKGGNFLVKVFQGEGLIEFIKVLRQGFNEVKTIKPSASRSRSKEIFLLAKGFKSY